MDVWLEGTLLADGSQAGAAKLLGGALLTDGSQAGAAKLLQAES